MGCKFLPALRTGPAIVDTAFSTAAIVANVVALLGPAGECSYSCPESKRQVGSQAHGKKQPRAFLPIDTRQS